ncbi:MAG: DUF3857 domain-containing protein [Anaeromyxobacter sp.]
MERLGEVSLPRGAQLLRLRTLKPDGRALEPEQAGSGKGSISLAGLEPGDLIELEYLRALPARAEGGTPGAFYFQETGEALARSTYVVRAPAGMGLGAEGAQMPDPEVKREGGYDVLRVERTDMPARVPEPFAPAQTEWIPFVTAGVGGSWQTVARGGGEAIAARVRATAEVRALADAVRAEAGPDAAPEALARAAYARVQRSILGSGSNLAEDAALVLSRGRGSRLLLLDAVLQALGLPTRVAVVKPFTADPASRRYPSNSAWSAPLLRVQAGAATLWL